jgi:hypothetical protein
VAFLAEYVADTGARSRSAAIRKAIGLLREHSAREGAVMDADQREGDAL